MGNAALRRGISIKNLKPNDLWHLFKSLRRTSLVDLVSIHNDCIIHDLSPPSSAAG